jgi:hypothetical protein
MAGNVIPRDALIAAIASGDLTFDSIDLPSSPSLRTYDTVSITIGETRMTGHAGTEPWSAHSRYTHVFVRDNTTWRLASAQGTPIAEA